MYFPQNVNSDYYGAADKKEKKIRYLENTLRFMLKGALYYMFNNLNNVEVTEIIIDGIPQNRPFSNDRIIQELFFDGYRGRTVPKEHISIPNNNIVSHHANSEKIHY